MLKVEQELIDGMWTTIARYNDNDKKDLCLDSCEYMRSLGGTEEYCSATQTLISTDPTNTIRTIRTWGGK